MKPVPFAYASARDLDELFDLFDRTNGSGRILAGGQSLVASLNLRLSDPGTLIDINPIAALRGIAVEGSVLRLGALTRHRELESHPLVRAHAPLLAMAAPHIAHPAIRNRGTLGGSLSFADPAAELPACVVALDARLVLRSRAGERRVAAGEFFKGLFETALAPGEVLAAVEIPLPAPDARFAFDEVARRRGDYAIVGLAAQVWLDAGRVRRASLVYFGAGTAPVPARAAAAALAGQVPQAAALAAAQAALDRDLDPPGDLNASPQMRRHLARVLLARALARLAS